MYGFVIFYRFELQIIFVEEAKVITDYGAPFVVGWSCSKR